MKATGGTPDPGALARRVERQTLTVARRNPDAKRRRRRGRRRPARPDFRYMAHEVFALPDHLDELDGVAVLELRVRDVDPAGLIEYARWYERKFLAYRRLIHGLDDVEPGSSDELELVAALDEHETALTADAEGLFEALPAAGRHARTLAGVRALLFDTLERLRTGRSSYADDWEASWLSARLLRIVAMLVPRDVAEPTPPRHHDETAWLDPPLIVDVLTECVLTAAPPRPSWARVMPHA